jgi:hypothetical protein
MLQTDFLHHSHFDDGTDGRKSGLIVFCRACSVQGKQFARFFMHHQSYLVYGEGSLARWSWPFILTALRPPSLLVFHSRRLAGGWVGRWHSHLFRREAKIRGVCVQECTHASDPEISTCAPLLRQPSQNVEWVAPTWESVGYNGKEPQNGRRAKFEWCIASAVQNHTWELERLKMRMSVVAMAIGKSNELWTQLSCFM